MKKKKKKQEKQRYESCVRGEAFRAINALAHACRPVSLRGNWPVATQGGSYPSPSLISSPPALERLTFPPHFSTRPACLPLQIKLSFDLQETVKEK